MTTTVERLDRARRLITSDDTLEDAIRAEVAGGFRDTIAPLLSLLDRHDSERAHRLYADIRGSLPRGAVWGPGEQQAGAAA